MPETGPVGEAWRATEAAVDAILGARHGDPFAVLGPHAVAAPAAAASHVLRAFVPGAASLALLRPGGEVALACRHPDGFFEALLPGPPPAPGYRLRAGGGAAFADPFGFGPCLGPLDDHLLREGTHTRLQERLGAHAVTHAGVAGTRFAVWAPRAGRVSVVGGFNGWDGRRHPMRRRPDSGIWEIFLPGLGAGAAYQYEIMAGEGPEAGRVLPLKADPLGFAAELRPGTASVVADPAPFAWGDAEWMAARAGRDALRAPLAIYEAHAPSWRRHPDGRFWHWDELAAALIPHVAGLGFTHIGLLPVMEHACDASWGYRPTGIFAPTARLGGPEGLARFVDAAHAAGIGVILDWVPAQVPPDAHGLARFDGAPLYERPDPRHGAEAGQGAATYDYGRPEVAAFLISSALYWLHHFHADGLRVDAVSCMIHLDHGRPPGGWVANDDGGTADHDARGFLRRLNALVAQEAPGALMIAEEATDFPGVTAADGLGFTFKWNLGWAHDTLRYMAHDPLQRRWFHGLMNFGLLYAFDEAFILPLSHDAVAPGQGSLLGRMPRGARAAPARTRTGSASPTSAATTASCGPIRARSCSSWAASSASGGNGRRRASWTGRCCGTRGTRGCRPWCAT